MGPYWKRDGSTTAWTPAAPNSWVIADAGPSPRATEGKEQQEPGCSHPPAQALDAVRPFVKTRCPPPTSTRSTAPRARSSTCAPTPPLFVITPGSKAKSGVTGARTDGRGGVGDDVAFSPWGTRVQSEISRLRRLLPGFLSAARPSFLVCPAKLRTPPRAGDSPVQSSAGRASVPLDPISSSNSSSQIILKWKPPTDPNGNITHYLCSASSSLRPATYKFDYCQKGMKLPSRAPTHVDNDEEQKWNQTDEQGQGARCCSCPKTDKQLKKEAEESEYRKTFEDYLHNEVFEIRPSRRRRSAVGVANATQPRLHTTPPSLPNASATGGPEEEEHKKVPLYVYSKEWTVISNLRHFTSYQIEVHACNHLTDPSRCSMAAYVSARTMPEGTPSPPVPRRARPTPVSALPVWGP
ncbi:hypothetical protein MATL_G00239190 [Megalops atlanticus]|uniref:Fibronectin type-III domain-containing protein n=1 Tax=Megalops atlanticus TaxID=7932 RepID=A0A9D3PC51_MEGAT|nr:hypothetical protein MATL_G00239190 [Megalops atlanticus]